MNREAIYTALFAKVTASAAFVTASRRLRHWSDVGPAEQPALFMVQKSETAQRVKGLPPKWTFSVELFIYVHAPDDLSPPASSLNPLIDAIEAALAPTVPADNQTLGGLVDHAWIAGKIETDEGALGGQGVAIIPLNIIVPS